MAHARDAGSGEFVTEEFAAEHPDTTVVEADAEPAQVGYCHQSDCPQQGVEVPLWHPVASHPVLCQCGHLLSAHRPGEEPEVEA